MNAIRLIHWNEEEAEAKARGLSAMGFEVDCRPPAAGSLLKELESQSPEAVIIDLSRIPSQGRDLALSIRKRKGTRHLPIVFVGGEEGKVESIERLLPDASFCEWAQVAAVIRGAIEASPREVVVPDSVFAAYADKPLWEKLGMTAVSRVAHVGAPPEVVEALAGAGEGATLVQGPAEGVGLSLWFIRSVDQLDASLPAIIEASKSAPVWLAWPKKGSALETDLSQQVVRAAGLQAGMVDYKICSIDETWSALLFTWRGQDR